MLIRTAQESDAPAIAAMGMSFIRAVKFGSEAEEEDVGAAVAALLQSDLGFGFVGVAPGGDLAGFILGVLSPVWFDPGQVTAAELAWWVDPPHRGTALAFRLVRQFERWAEAKGATRVALSDTEFLDTAAAAGPVIERLGYSIAERAYLKEL